MNLVGDEDLRAVVDDTLSLHSVGGTGVLQHLLRHRLYDAGTNAAEDVIAGVLLDYYGVDAVPREDLPEQKPGRARTDDGDLRLHVGRPVKLSDRSDHNLKLRARHGQPTQLFGQSDHRPPETSQTMMQRTIPTYALYAGDGESLLDQWVHCETIAVRSARHRWHIRTHAIAGTSAPMRTPTSIRSCTSAPAA